MLVRGQTEAPSNGLNLTFTPIDVPGAVFTEAWGINTAGEIVGNYGRSTSIDSHGFVYNAGNFSYFDYPGQSLTVATKVNDFGTIVGYAGQYPVYSFSYDGTTFTPVQVGSKTTFAYGINNIGSIVGGAGTIYATLGFEIQELRSKRVSPPGTYIYVVGTAINNLGEIAGYADNQGWTYHGGTFQTVAFPGAQQTKPLGMNDSGIVVGWYGVGIYSYAFAEKNGRYISFAYPGATFTSASGINNSGQIVGAYTSDFATWHGFVTSPISPEDFEQPGCCVSGAGTSSLTQ